MENKEDDKNIENNSNLKKEKIKFTKKMQYSITKVSKYDEMVDLGFKSSLKYFLGLICFLSILYPIVVAIGTFVRSSGDISIGTYIYNIFIYYVANVIFLILVYLFFIIIISLCMFIITRIIKIKESFAKWLSYTIYASTLSLIIYEIFFLLDMTGLNIPYYDLITLIIIYIYIGILLRKKRGGNNDDIYRKNKKKSKRRNKNNNPA